MLRCRIDALNRSVLDDLTAERSVWGLRRATPRIVDAEIGNVLRRRVLRGELPEGDAPALLLAASPLIDYRYEMVGSLGQAAWALRESLRFYDALYVALAQAFSVPLLTGDDRLSRAPGLPCAVELTPGAG